tara:strand:- start:684 stop:1019 length:336 start_codon:yes stop_codon:yes gene_type:complete
MRILFFGFAYTLTLFLTISLFSGNAMVGNIEAGKARYAENCGNCHGPAGMGLASYPKIAGKEIAYIIDRLETYRAGIEIGPNSALMIMMAQPLSDVEIANLAAYLNAQNTK